MILSRRALVLSGVAVGALAFVPGRLFAQGVPDAVNLADRPGMVPRDIFVAYASTKGVTRAELGILRGLGRWNARLATPVSPQVVQAIARRLGSRFTPYTSSARLVFPFLPVGVPINAAAMRG